ncbi:MAG: hypothetical protein ACKOE2_10660, partial [Actinomycetales bacterium]
MSAQDEVLERARAAYTRSRWDEARTALQEADAEHPLEAEDLERLAWSCRWAGDPGAFLDALERAETAFVAADHLAGAARMALGQARQHAILLDSAVALTCCVRATEYLTG